MIGHKKRIFTYLSLFLYLSITPIAHTQTLNDARAIPIFDDFDFFQDDDLSDMLDFSDATISTRAEPIDILTALKIFAGEDFDILQQNFFLRTNDIHQRNVLDLPIFEPHCIYPPKKWHVGGQLFWNKVNKSYFGPQDIDNDKSEYGLESYLSLTDENFLTVLTQRVDDLFELLDLDFDVEMILSLFRNMTVEKRRVGAMFHGQYFWKRLTLRFLWPLYYNECNLQFPTQADTDAVYEAFGLDPEDDDEDFQDAHFVSDQLGFGDGRIELDAIVSQGETYNFRAGAFTTLPIAFAFKKGVKGTYFPKNNIITTLRFADIDIDALFDLTDDPDTSPEVQEAFDILSNFLLGSLDHMNATLLNASLGNQHLSVGGFIRSQSQLSAFISSSWAEKIFWHSRGSIEYFFSRKHKRFFLKTINEGDFAKRDFCDEDEAEENLTFIEDELTDRFYPLYFDTKIQPGLLFRWTSRFMFVPNEHWTVTLGSDWWVKTSETFAVNNIDAPSKTLSNLRVDLAQREYPYQGKMLAGLSYAWDRPERSWLISLDGDVTLYHDGIGDDYTIGINIEARF